MVATALLRTWSLLAKSIVVVTAASYTLGLTGIINFLPKKFLF